MGLFLSMAGVAGTSRGELEEALRAYATARGGHFAREDGPFEAPGIMAFAEGRGRNVTVLYPWDFLGWDDASACLSRALHSPVFSLHIHDEDLWMYSLFSEGEEVDRFNPIPDYWSDAMSQEECDLWAGDAGEVARVWPGARAEEIRDYLVRWDLDDEAPGKAYPDDRHTLLDCSQVIDFMRRLGLEFPLDRDGRVVGRTYRFKVSGPE